MAHGLRNFSSPTEAFPQPLALHPPSLSPHTEQTRLLRQQTPVRAVLERVPPPLGEVVRLADGAEDGEVEDEGDDLRAAVERAGDDVVVWGRG